MIRLVAKCASTWANHRDGSLGQKDGSLAIVATAGGSAAAGGAGGSAGLSGILSHAHVGGHHYGEYTKLVENECATSTGDLNSIP